MRVWDSQKTVSCSQGFISLFSTKRQGRVALNIYIFDDLEAQSTLARQIIIDLVSFFDSFS